MRFLAKSFNPNNGAFTVVVRDDDSKISSPYTIDINHPKYDDLKECFMKNDANKFVEYYQIKKEKIEQRKLVDYVGGTGLEITGDKITYRGEELHNVYAKRIIDMRKDRMPVDAMIKFLENLMKNPSNRSKTELPDFLNNRNMPLTDDGHFLAYKSVQSDYYSKTSGTLKPLTGTVNEEGHIYNGVGEIIRCERSDVDDERTNECSHGLHVGGLQYSGPNGWFTGSGDRVVIVKVNPADVVSVPKDYNAQKMRVCAYEVISDYEAALPETCYNVKRMDVSKELVEFKDLKATNEIMFQYTNKGVVETRHMIVEDVENWSNENDTICGPLLKGDPSYNAAETVYRTFSRIKMSEIYILHESPKD